MVYAPFRALGAVAVIGVLDGAGGDHNNYHHYHHTTNAFLNVLTVCWNCAKHLTSIPSLNPHNILNR